MYSKEDIKNFLKPFIATKNPLINCNCGGHKHTYTEKVGRMTSTCLSVIKSNNIGLFDFLNAEIHENFNVIELYNYLYEETNICEKCGREKELISLKKGYKRCLYCEAQKIKSIKNKRDFFNYIIDNVHVFGVGYLNKIKNNKILLTLLKSFDDFCDEVLNDEESLYLFLTDTNKHMCEFCNKVPTRFLTFKTGKYKQFCSPECRTKWFAERQRIDNTCHRMTEETKINALKKQSLTMKQKIKNGEFTPPTTNSWCKSRHIVKFKRNDKIVIVKLRSCFEAIYQLQNPNCLYEKIRIPYEFKGEWHNYIVDFFDPVTKTLIEIKPHSLLEKEKNIVKEEAAKIYASNNGFNFIYVTEEDLFKNPFDIELLKYCEDNEKTKLIKKFKMYKSRLVLLNEN